MDEKELNSLLEKLEFKVTGFDENGREMIIQQGLGLGAMEFDVPMLGVASFQIKVKEIEGGY